ARAGASSYSATESAHGKEIAAWQLSRPFDKHPARVAGLDERSGFLLDLEEAPTAPLDEARMLYEWTDAALLLVVPGRELSAAARALRDRGCDPRHLGSDRLRGCAGGPATGRVARVDQRGHPSRSSER